MAQITEVAPDLFRITTFLEPFNLQFSQFLVRDAEPLLYHTGPRAVSGGEGDGGVAHRRPHLALDRVQPFRGR